MSAAGPAPTGPRRWAVIVLAILGVGLILAPVAFQMFSRAPKGATMIAEFRPYMTSARLDGFQRDLAEIDAGVREGGTRVADRLTGPGGDGAFRARYPLFAQFQRQWTPIYADMKDLLDTIQANRGNYDAVAALPSFRLFPWFFLIPGALVLALAGAALVRPSWWNTIRWLVVAIGIGLVLAPAVFQMFSRAPKGGHMMTAFKTLETRKKVERIQGYFGTIAVGQGAVRLQLVPALERSGLTADEVAERYPAVTTLNERWPRILGDLAPMIGVMSDNVDNYEAVAALPPFPLFPWFFVAGGLLTAAFAAAAGPARARHRAPPVNDLPRPQPQGAP